MSVIQSVDRALKLLQLIASSKDWIGVRELARQIKLTPPTTHNLLRTLLQNSFVEYDSGTRQYRLGLAALRLGEGSNPLSHMKDFARAYLEALVHELDETVIALTMMDGKVVVVDWIQANHPLAVNHNRGIIENPIIFASGRVLLAHQSRDVQVQFAGRENLSRLGPGNPITLDDFLVLMGDIRTSGYAETLNVTNSGIAAVGAPVFDSNGQIVMAVGCSAPISRSTTFEIQRARNRLVEVTKLMTQKLGMKKALA